MKYIDIHSHLNLKNFKDDLSIVLLNMEEKNVGTIIIGVDKETSKEALRLSNENKNIYACVGVHPTDSKDDFEENFFEELIKNKKVVAIGECGLDYFQNDKSKDKQIKLFKKQIDFAVKHDLPLMLHVRNAVGTEGAKSAYDDTLSVLEEKKKEYGNKLRGNSHFFMGSEAIAKRYFSIGFTVSFTGLITYNNSFDELIKSIPIEMIHAETDSPFVAPVPYKGQRSEPSYVTQVVKKIAEIKEMTEEIMIEKLLQNAYRLFNLRA